MSHVKIDAQVLGMHREKFRTELYDNVLAFWLRYSLDHEHGGFFNCLDRDGRPYDFKKHVWLQGRQTWMMSKIYNANRDKADAQQYLDAAELGATFLRKHAKTADNRVYFCLTRDGKPVSMQRKIFSECFYVMALSEYARASGDQSARDEARELFDAVLTYAKDPSLVGRPVYEGTPKLSSLAVPMILLNLIEEVNDPGENSYADVAKWCVDRINMHTRPELSLVLEMVGTDGKLVDTPEGRLVNPGHAIEAAWFLMDYARKHNDESLLRQAIRIMEWSFDFGWDEQYGGLFYFLDRDGYSPLQLEWNMKLWWPHCEAMIAYLMAYQATGDDKYFKRFEHLTDYSFKHFSDPEHGEWFGYLDRQGKMSQRFKGGPYKGCFHVPRALFICERILGELMNG
ncbi:AGE family epimerase/isomerase [Candidatus Sumerlaeota bacterium]|nr:AGE family epimerase/isomerase [Candidatus Sumerlaeota bacterium]